MSDTRMSVSALVLAIVLAAALAGCGTATLTGRGMVRVDGLQDDGQLLCGEPGQIIAIKGTGFLSEHGTDVTVTFTALEGTPFQGGTSAMEEVMGTVVDNETIEAAVPVAIGQIQATIMVTLPGLNYGISPPDVLDIGGTLIGPFAQMDLYDATGNVTLGIAAGPGVLTNDLPATCGSGQGDDDETTPVKPGAPGSTNSAADFVVVAYDQTTNLGGTVQMNPDGSFDYDPPLGVGGTTQAPVLDSFTYTLDENGRTSVGFVQISIVEVVWFIDDAAPPGGSGHFAAPFDSLISFNAVQGGGNDDQPQPGDWIFVYQNTVLPYYDEGIVLLNDQKLIGQGVDLFVNGQTIVTASANPVLTNTGIGIGTELSLDCIILADRNRVAGLTVEGVSGNGIYGFAVSGPTMIDQVRIENVGSDGIFLENQFGGLVEIGDPAGTIFPDVDIQDVGGNGINVSGGLATVNSTGLVGGPSLNVSAAQISGAGANGINAVNVNLAVDLSSIDDALTGIDFTTISFGTLCTLDVTNSNIGLDTEMNFRGIDIHPVSGDIDAVVATNEIIANEEALRGGNFSTGGAFEIEVERNGFECLITGAIPAVYLYGFDTTVTSLDSNNVHGNNQGGGLWCESVTFDADPGTAGIQQVSGGTSQLGNNAVARIEGTSLGMFGCTGDLLFDAVTIWQVGGDPTGVQNTGALTLTITTKTLDRTP